MKKKRVLVLCSLASSFQAPLFPGDRRLDGPVFPSPPSFLGGLLSSLPPALLGSGLWNERRKTELLGVTHLCLEGLQPAFVPLSHSFSIFLKMPHGQKKKKPTWSIFYFKISRGDFPGGPVVENLPSNAGVVGLISGRKLRSYMPRGS